MKELSNHQYKHYSGINPGTHEEKKPAACNCTNGCHINRKGDLVISTEPNNHLVNCPIRKKIRTIDTDYFLSEEDYCDIVYTIGGVLS